jgi:Flp pilus assembly protein TadD
MKLLSSIAVLFAVVALIPVTLFAQVGEGSLVGKVLDRDGKPLQGAVVRIQNVSTNQIDQAKTTKTGNYSIDGLYTGRFKATLIVDGQDLITIGEGQGDYVFVSSGQATTLNFDMRKIAAAVPPKAPPSAAPAKADNKGKSDSDKKTDQEMRAEFSAGLAALNAQNWDEAIKQLQLAAAKDPSQAPIFGNLGIAFLHAKKYDDAVEAFRKSVALNPGDPGVHGQLSLALGQSGKMDDAVQEVQAAVKLDPSVAAVSYFNLGAVLTGQGKSKEAVEMFKKAIEADPKNAPSYYQLGIAYFSSPDTIPAAISALEKYLQLEPMGQNAEAARQLIAAAKASPPAANK